MHPAEWAPPYARSAQPARGGRAAIGRVRADRPIDSGIDGRVPTTGGVHAGHGGRPGLPARCVPSSTARARSEGKPQRRARRRDSRAVDHGRGCAGEHPARVSVRMPKHRLAVFTAWTDAPGRHRARRPHDRARPRCRPRRRHGRRLNGSGARPPSPGTTPAWRAPIPPGLRRSSVLGYGERHQMCTIPSGIRQGGTHPNSRGLSRDKVLGCTSSLQRSRR